MAFGLSHEDLKARRKGIARDIARGKFFVWLKGINILTFTPPGFKQTLSVKYPDARLAVCDKCKKNFKTRDMCRVRNTHTAPPWTTAYVCITMDESCTDADGNFVDKPLTLRMVQWQPYAVKKTFSSKTPVCSACKRTNRTKNFCRERHKHRHLPWCTVYVLLSALDNADPHTVVAGASKPAPSSPEANGTQERPIKDEAPETAIKRTATDGTPPTDSSHSTLSPEVPEGEKKIPVVDDDSKSAIIATEPPGPGDNIHDIAESRTFLALVSSRNTSIHWLDLVEYEEAMPNFTQTPAAGVAPESPFPAAPRVVSTMTRLECIQLPRLRGKRYCDLCVLVFTPSGSLSRIQATLYPAQT
eukprot:scaffold3763_cov165-Amphora_coffeaeformis.AAC.19